MGRCANFCLLEADERSINRHTMTAMWCTIGVLSFGKPGDELAPKSKKGVIDAI